MVRGHLTLLCAAALLLGSAAGDMRDELHAMAARYITNLSAIAPAAGRDTTFDYYQRLIDDADLLDDPSVPPGYTSGQWSQTVRRTAQLDMSLADQLMRSSYQSMAAIRGLGETLVRSSKDGTMQRLPSTFPAVIHPVNPRR